MCNRIKVGELCWPVKYIIFVLLVVLPGEESLVGRGIVLLEHPPLSWNAQQSEAREDYPPTDTNVLMPVKVVLNTAQLANPCC